MKSVLKNCKTPRFDVDYRERLEQSRTATNAVRMPRLGYELYRVYKIEQKKEVSVPNFNGMYINSGTGGKSSFTMNVFKGRQSGKSNWQQVLWAFIDDLETKIEPAYEVKWLKPKHATLLRMKGHNVELAEMGDNGFKTGFIRLGR